MNRSIQKIIWIDNQEVKIENGTTEIVVHRTPHPSFKARFPFDLRTLPAHVSTIDPPSLYWLGNLYRSIREQSGKQLQLFNNY